MRYQSTLFTILAFGLLPAAAQEATEEGRRYNGNFYGFVTMGRCNHGYGQFGGGGGAEALLWKGVTVGIDGAYQQFTDGWGYGLVTPQFGYHFANRQRMGRWDPFVTAGAGWAVSGGVGSAGNFGAGVIYWFKRNIGIRLEYRTHVVAAEEVVSTFRLGISLR